MSELDLEIIGPALIAGLLVLSTHCLLGREVVKRGIIFMDLAIAQIAGLGVIMAGFFHLGEFPILLQLFACSFALLGALLLAWSEIKLKQFQEPLIGVFFVLSASASILLLSHDPQAGEHLKDLLAGQILWVTYPQLWAFAAISLLVLIGWFFIPNKKLSFYCLFAISVTASVQIVGIYLVFSSLIIPALASISLGNKKAFIGSLLIGALGYASGLWLSLVWDLPSSALIVWCMAFWAAIFYLSLSKIAVTEKTCPRNDSAV